jgi:hypothetical protein
MDTNVLWLGAGVLAAFALVLFGVGWVSGRRTGVGVPAPPGTRKPRGRRPGNPGGGEPPGPVGDRVHRAGPGAAREAPRGGREAHIAGYEVAAGVADR